MSQSPTRLRKYSKKQHQSEAESWAVDDSDDRPRSRVSRMNQEMRVR